METCVRGFSFMPPAKVEEMDLQYVEGDELARTWKSSRRERAKQQEQKIWDEFVKEQDVVDSVCKDDPYQFLGQLPEACLKELMESDLHKLELEVEENMKSLQEPEQQDEEINNRHDDKDIQHVTFADEIDENQCDMFHIFDDEISGADDEVLNESLVSPCTVRDRCLSPVCPPAAPVTSEAPEAPAAPMATNPPDPNISDEHSDSVSEKSSENVTNVIETSIYCAKIKDLRLKINEEILDIISTLERVAVDVQNMEREQINAMLKRSKEFCSRFNRIYIYQLQRQMNDICRNDRLSLPFAQYTHFQSQMVRTASLHQNMLHAFQVYHRSAAGTACVRDSAACLRRLGGAARDVGARGQARAPPRLLAAHAAIYTDDLVPTCDKLDVALDEFTAKVSHYVESVENYNTYHSKKAYGKDKMKKRSDGKQSLSKLRSTGTDTNAKLSMYSLNQYSKCSSKENTSGTSKKSSSVVLTDPRARPSGNTPVQPPRKKSPRWRRPLMRAPPGRGRRAARTRRPPLDPTTMVEVLDSISSHISREPSPSARQSKDGTPQANNTTNTPRTSKSSKENTPRTFHSQNTEMSLKLPYGSAKLKYKQNSPNEQIPSRLPLKSTPSSIKSGQDPEEVIPLSSVSKIQCCKKDKNDHQKDKGKTNSKINLKTKQDKRKLEVSKDNRTKAVDDEINDFRKEDQKSEPKNNTANATKNLEKASPREKGVEDKLKVSETEAAPVGDMTDLLKTLCDGDTTVKKCERISGARNAQLVCISSASSPRQANTPQLLRILEETIQKKAPKSLCGLKQSANRRDHDRYRLMFNISERTTEKLFQYRTKFVQHMLTSSMYANSAVGKPWEMIGCVSEQIINELLLGCVTEMELRKYIMDLYKNETC